MRRVGGRPVMAVATMTVVAMAVAGCGHSAPAGQSDRHTGTAPQSHPTASTPSDSGGSQRDPKAESTGPVSLKINVAKGADQVKVDKVIKVSAANATLSKITVTGHFVDHGTEKKSVIAGDLDRSGSTWTASQLLEPGADYTVKATASGSDGDDHTTTRHFSTEDLSLDQQIFPDFVSLGKKVGVGMPVILKFDRPVADRAAFQKHLHVTSVPSQPGSWHWYSDTEVHWRPADYWKPGTKVTATADLNSVPAGDGEYGQKDARTSFTVGDSVITKVNLKTDVAKVYVNGAKARTIYVSGGKPGSESSSGTTLITQKLTDYTMTSEMIGLPKKGPESYALTAAYAMRLTTSGQFLHSAPWNAGYFGRQNASHGCVGMSVEDSGWLFKHALPGSPVTVTGTSRPLEELNGLTDWNVDFATYAKGSAI